MAFGDPTLREGLRPLPHSREEIDGIAALFGANGRSYRGDAATEERVRAEAPGARYLHFATHGLLDPRSPLDSALVSRRPGGTATTVCSARGRCANASIWTRTW